MTGWLLPRGAKSSDPKEPTIVQLWGFIKMKTATQTVTTIKHQIKAVSKA
jgi:hypothetical protein